MDLFGVFDEAPEQALEKTPKPRSGEKSNVAKVSEQDASTDVASSSRKGSKKRSASHKFEEEPKEEDDESHKKQRIVPHTADAVEVEATQIDSSTQEQRRHEVRHEVALPPDYNYVPIQNHKMSDNPARSYPFELDPFQAMSVAAIERGESVLVSAHTSAGKTVVAEYAVAQSLRGKQRVIYTSPIKALSNQKYRDMLAQFGDVGLMTGDVTINPEASCLVMTTEILRSMLYRGSEVMREVAWVVFDEIHYMRDKERGVVWEETIILLPDNVRYVFLSATIPNAMEFAEWICKIHEQPCHVVYTDYRPTPLQHYLFPEGGAGLYLVVDEKGNFREDNFHKAMSLLGGDKQQSEKGDDRKRVVTQKGADIYKIIKMIMLKNYNPVIVFSFSKRECENLAVKTAKVPFNSDAEQDLVAKVFNNALSSLAPADRELEQVVSIYPLLKRGIGVHHSGLLPILKEVIELLFQEGLIKVLFATETFSIGLNMPAKTVVFTSVRKYDGNAMRWVSGGEYIQMSGRAGRRGKDDRGYVIMMINEQMEPTVAKGMVKGVADRLDSAFHLGYNMILNLLRVEGISPEFMLERCFFQFQNAAKVPQLEKRKRHLLTEARNMAVEDEETVAEYWQLKQKIAEYGRDIAKVVAHPGHSLKFLQRGRLVKVQVNSDLDFGWAVVSQVNQRQKPRHSNPDWDDWDRYIVDVVVDVVSTTPVHLIRKGDPQLVPGVRPPHDGEQYRTEVLPVTLKSIVALANLRTHVPDQLASPKQRAVLSKSVREISKRFPDGIPLLDPVESMKIKDGEFLQLVRKAEVLEAKCASNPLAESPRLGELYERYNDKQRMLAEAVDVDRQVSDAQAILQMDELKNRKRVLRKLGFTSPDDIVELKGRVACEISTGDELLLTELIFNGTFSTLGPEQCAALLSCFVFDEKVNEKGQALNPALKEPFRALQAMATQIAKVSTECKMPIVESEYIEKFRPHLMDVVFQWARGCSFAQICKMTDVFEGSLVRMFRRLEELMRQMASAAMTIGNEELAQKMERALELIKRDLVSAASLYF